MSEVPLDMSMGTRRVPKFEAPVLVKVAPAADVRVYPTPYTLHPTPYTLHPTPYTLPPTPYTLHPTPCTLHPTHTLNPRQGGLPDVVKEPAVAATR